MAECRKADKQLLEQQWSLCPEFTLCFPPAVCKLSHFIEEPLSANLMRTVSLLKTVFLDTKNYVAMNHTGPQRQLSPLLHKCVDHIKKILWTITKIKA
jgi:hypothetical protein